MANMNENLPVFEAPDIVDLSGGPQPLGPCEPGDCFPGYAACGCGTCGPGC